MFADNRNLLNSFKQKGKSTLKDAGLSGSARKDVNTVLRKVGTRMALGTAAAGIPRAVFIS